MAVQKYKNKKYKSRINGKHTIQYNTWSAMRQRCNNAALHKKHPSYKDCYICDEWLDFQNFASWFDQNYIKDYQLDKDLLFSGNKEYGPNTCCFIPQEINLAIITPYKKRKLPVGVYKHHYSNKKYVTRIKINKISKHIGIFDNVEDAFECYKNFKKSELIQLANKYKDKIKYKAYNSLINYNIKY